MKFKTYLYLVLLALTMLGCKSNRKSLDNTFYVFNNGVRTLLNCPESYEDQAKLVKRLGYEGIGGHSAVNYYELRAALDKFELDLPEMYYPMNIVDGEITYHDDLKNMLIHSRDRNLLLALHLHADTSVNNRDKGDSLFAESIRDLADFASPLNVKIAIYPHVNFYCETVEHAIKIAKLCERENVGIIYNLCHLLKAEGEEGWEQKALDALPWLFMVGINGADTGDTKNMVWNRLIQPLGEGTFDTYQLVKLFKDNGYNGKFGLQCYNIQQDCETALAKSIQTWESYKEKYAKGL